MFMMCQDAHGHFTETFGAEAAQRGREHGETVLTGRKITLLRVIPP